MFNDKKQLSQNEELEKELLEANRVIVRIWKSHANLRQQGQTVGHVSIETGNRYMSLWPKQENPENPFEQSAKESEGKGIIKPISNEFVLNYEIERDEYEKRVPEDTFCFYSLNVDAIKGKFQEFQQELKGWCLFGGICNNAESCVSMAWRLLEAGNIRRLVSHSEESSISSRESIFGSFFSGKRASRSQKEESTRGSIYSSENIINMLIKSPDSLAPLLQQAKRKELIQKPLTKAIYFEGEWQDNNNNNNAAPFVPQ